MYHFVRISYSTVLSCLLYGSAFHIRHVISLTIPPNGLTVPLTPQSPCKLGATRDLLFEEVLHRLLEATFELILDLVSTFSVSWKSQIVVAYRHINGQNCVFDRYITST